MRYFNVKLSKVVMIPLEEGVIDGKINNNHLIYLAMAKAKDMIVHNHSSVDLIDSGTKQLIPLTHRPSQNTVSLIDV